MKSQKLDPAVGKILEEIAESNNPAVRAALGDAAAAACAPITTRRARLQAPFDLSANATKPRKL
jgi:hypothetical protein